MRSICNTQRMIDSAIYRIHRQIAFREKKGFGYRMRKWEISGLSQKSGIWSSRNRFKRNRSRNDQRSSWKRMRYHLQRYVYYEYRVGYFWSDHLDKDYPSWEKRRDSKNHPENIYGSNEVREDIHHITKQRKQQPSELIQRQGRDSARDIRSVIMTGEMIASQFFYARGSTEDIQWIQKRSDRIGWKRTTDHYMRKVICNLLSNA